MHTFAIYIYASWQSNILSGLRSSSFLGFYICCLWLTQGFLFLSLNNLSFRSIFILFGKLSTIPVTAMSVISEDYSPVLEKCALCYTRFSFFNA